MRKQEVDISGAQFFSLRSTVLSHGWVNLDPFDWDDQLGMLTLPIFSGRRVYWGKLSFEVERETVLYCSTTDILPEDSPCISRSLRRMLSLDQDIQGLVSTCRSANQKDYLKLLHAGWGRIFRAQSAWEDAAKTILTTNASWSFTKKMCRSLCQNLGNHGAFPDPKCVAGQSEIYLSKCL